MLIKAKIYWSDLYVSQIALKIQDLHVKTSYPKVVCIWTPKTIDFPFVLNGKLIAFSAPVFKHIRVNYMPFPDIINY